jgi:hypothetical protein
VEGSADFLFVSRCRCRIRGSVIASLGDKMERATRSHGLHRQRRARFPSPPSGLGMNHHSHGKRKAISPHSFAPSPRSSTQVGSSSPRRAPVNSSEVGDDEDEKKKDDMVRRKRAELERLLLCDGFNAATSVPELQRWDISAATRQNGAWKGGIELSYRFGRRTMMLCVF